ncbi:MAG TPA: hypothetical protein DCY94_02480 [Firmicutes bacterium]|nr:hypothetical protein [Bacillota bacterium]
MDAEMKKILEHTVENLKSRLGGKAREIIDPIYLELASSLYGMGQFLLENGSLVDGFEVEAFLRLAKSIDEAHTLIGNRKLTDREILILKRLVADEETVLYYLYGYGKKKASFENGNIELKGKLENAKEAINRVSLQFVLNRYRFLENGNTDAIESLYNSLMSFFEREIAGIEGQTESNNPDMYRLCERKLEMIGLLSGNLEVMLSTPNMLRSQLLFEKLSKANHILNDSDRVRDEEKRTAL